MYLIQSHELIKAEGFSLNIGRGKAEEIKKTFKTFIEFKVLLIN